MNFEEFDNDYNVMVVHPSFYRYFFPNKWELIRWGFEAIQDAIYFRFTLEDNIDRCAFFESLSKGWYEMYVWTDEDE
jgi:hypothetical protein